jgi:hypothetical protein
MTALYVYALVPSGLDAPLGTGLLDEALRVVPVGPMGAVVGDVDDTPSIAPASLRRHDEVVRRIARASDAILPFRFGATVLSAAELAEGLAPRVRSRDAARSATRGCDQMTLRLYSEALPARSADPPAAGPGTRWLRERSAARLAASLPELARVRATLASSVRAESIETHDTPPLRASLFHLVERARLVEYRAQVDALAASIAPARVAATGPWPPYAFTELE